MAELLPNEIDRLWTSAMNSGRWAWCPSKVIVSRGLRTYTSSNLTLGRNCAVAPWRDPVMPLTDKLCTEKFPFLCEV